MHRMVPQESRPSTDWKKNPAMVKVVKGLIDQGILEVVHEDGRTTITTTAAGDNYLKTIEAAEEADAAAEVARQELLSAVGK